VTADAALLQGEGLSVRYRLPGGGLFGGNSRWLDALAEVSFSVPPGGRLGVVGESGSGKSTLARVVLGLVGASGGRVLWQGVPVDYHDAPALRALRRQMQVVFQDPFNSLDPRMTAGEAVAEALHALLGAMTRDRSRECVVAALDEVGLGPAFLERYPHELSGGQCQRVAIARAVVGGPRLLVCDEAVSALDVSVQAQIVNLLHELSLRRGMALVFISHNLAVVRHLCDEVLVLQRGRLVEHGPCAGLFDAPQAAYTRALLEAVPEPDPAMERARRARLAAARRE
jgi:ABC-type oligopeptide transport system ATPase subunit